VIGIAIRDAKLVASCSPRRCSVSRDSAAIALPVKVRTSSCIARSSRQSTAVAASSSNSRAASTYSSCPRKPGPELAAIRISAFRIGASSLTDRLVGRHVS
jgi:hypothetical protein